MKQDLISQIQQTINQNDTQQRIIPPLEKWQPKSCGDMDLTILANGEWWHNGTKMTRQSLVDLFAKVLWAEIDNDNVVHYFLKTPVEKIGIKVEDAPLQIVDVELVKKDSLNWIVFTTSQGDRVCLDNEHELRFGLPFCNADTTQSRIEKQAEQPYIRVRKNGDSVLYGLIARSVFFHLVNMGELVEVGDTVALQLVSGGNTFTLSMADVPLS